MQKLEKIKNIAVIRTDRIGEVLLSTVAVDALRKSYPEAEIYFVTSEYSKPLLDERADISGILTMDTSRGAGVVANALKLASFLKEKKTDMAVVLNPHKALHLGCFLAGVKMRLGYDRKWGFLLNIKAEDTRYEGAKHEIEYTLDLLFLVGVTDPDPFPSITIPSAYNEAAESILKAKGISPGSKIVAIHPGTSNPAKMWPHEWYAELIRKIKAFSDEFAVLVIGGKEEKDLVRKLIDEARDGVIDLSGDLDLKTLAAVLGKCDLFIGNDTGPMHMASSMRVPVIAIFGRNIPGVSPMRWRPWGVENKVFHESPGCEPCMDTSCPFGYKCMRSIGVDEVFEAVREKLGK